MKKLTICLIVLFNICVVLNAAKKPDWVTNNGFSQKHPENQYVVGFGLATGTDMAERKLNAEQSAKTEFYEDKKKVVYYKIPYHNCTPNLRFEKCVFGYCEAGASRYGLIWVVPRNAKKELRGTRYNNTAVW